MIFSFDLKDLESQHHRQFLKLDNNTIHSAHLAYDYKIGEHFQGRTIQEVFSWKQLEEIIHSNQKKVAEFAKGIDFHGVLISTEVSYDFLSQELCSFSWKISSNAGVGESIMFINQSAQRKGEYFQAKIKRIIPLAEMKQSIIEDAENAQEYLALMQRHVEHWGDQNVTEAFPHEIKPDDSKRKVVFFESPTALQIHPYPQLLVFSRNPVAYID